MTGRRSAFGFLGAMALSAALLVSLPGAPAGSAPGITAPYRPDAVLVRFSDGSTATQRASARASVPGLQLVSLPAGSDVAAAIARLQADPSVVYAEPDYAVHELVTYSSNDGYFTGGSLWGMYGDTTTPSNQYGSQAAEAWAAGYVGSSTVYVGVIDEGQQWNHPDLAANEWVNPGESGGGKETDGVDNDGNGYKDDVHGWDFYSNDNSTYDGTGDDHGTHVSGTIGGVGGNSTGVAGVNWNVKIIPAKFLGPSGGYLSGAVSALYYLRDLKVSKGINIVATSNSWGGGGYSSSLVNAINAAGNAGMLFIAAAGNSGVNIDRSASYPASYVCQATYAGVSYDCLIAVAAINSSGGTPPWTNYGATGVDLGAPGVGIYSTLPVNTYGSYSGTSMATPHVSGAAALCASINGSATPAQLKEWVLNGTYTSSLAGKTVTGDRLDIGRLYRLCDGSLKTGLVTVTFSGAKGTVTLSATNTTSRTCSATCTATYDDGQQVTLTARAASGYTFVGWSGLVGATCSGTTCTVTISQATLATATATFRK